jgi:hypothetical protein
MSKTLEMINQLPDAKVIEVSKVLFNRLYAEVPYDDVLANARDQALLEPLLSLGEDALGSNLTAEDSARIGRQMVSHLAADETFEPIVREAVEKVQQSDKLVVDVILAVGLVVNLTLLVATTRIDVSKDADGNISWRFKKREASPELVKAVVEPVADLATKVGQ